MNGHNLGRYWWIGPQQTLYVPGVWLKRGKNDVTVFEEVKTDSASLEGFPAEAILTDLRREPVLPTKRGRIHLTWHSSS